MAYTLYTHSFTRRLSDLNFRNFAVRLDQAGKRSIFRVIENSRIRRIRFVGHVRFHNFCLTVSSNVIVNIKNTVIPLVFNVGTESMLPILPNVETNNREGFKPEDISFLKRNTPICVINQHREHYKKSLRTLY